jgi:hypothetical protein
MFVFDRNFSYDTELARSETNINRVQTPPIPDQDYLSSPKIGARLWRRMSEPVNDLPKQRIKKRKPVYVRQQAVANNNNRVLIEKVEMLHSFTQDTLDAIKQEQDTGAACNTTDTTKKESAELLKILDETHQQFRNNLLKGIYQKRHGSISSAGNRESPAQSDQEVDSDSKSRKLEQVKKLTEAAKRIPEKPLVQVQGDEMLFLKIDHAIEREESIEEAAAEIHHPLTPTVLDLRESRSNPMLHDLNQIKELEIIEEQNEQDNQSDSGEATSLLQEETEINNLDARPK